jgi:biopolymer transport protein ExbB
MLNFFIQDAAEDALLLEPEVTEQTLSIMELIVNGGTGGMIIIGTLAILLFVALYVYFERLFAIKAASKYDANFMNQIRDNVAGGNLQAAKVLCAQQNSPVSRLTEKGISRIGSPLDDINTAIENAGKKRKCTRYHCRSSTYDWFLRDCNWYGISFSSARYK